jgi:heterodisulfide reductase subunit A
MSDDLHIGLYICHCGHNIAGVISPEVLAEQARGWPRVAVCRDHLYSCSEAGQKDIAKDIQQFGLNRLVVAACSPKLHEPTFRHLLAENGVNPYLLEIVNLREHCSWVHAQEPDAALVKALELIRMGLAKVWAAVPLAERQVPLTRTALVIGGGPAGLRSALDIAHAGIPVTLVERAPVLGGMANRLYKTFPQGQSIVSHINPMMAAVTLHPGITVLTDRAVTGIRGHLGNYRVKVTPTQPRVTKACDLCGECAAVCPVQVPDDREPAQAPRPAIYRPSPTVFPARYVVDVALCDRCGLCVPACPRQAIILEAEGEIESILKVGSIMVATGFAPFESAGPGPPSPRSSPRWPWNACWTPRGPPGAG